MRYAEYLVSLLAIMGLLEKATCSDYSEFTIEEVLQSLLHNRLGFGWNRFLIIEEFDYKKKKTTNRSYDQIKSV